MRVRTLSLAAAFVATATFAACADQPTSPAVADQLSDHSIHGKKDKADKGRAALLTNIPVSGVLSDGGSFTGTFTAQRFTLDEATRTLTLTGLLTGTAVDASGVSTAISQVVTAPATLAREAGSAALVRPVAMQATCDVLFLDLGPLNLDLLGLTLDLSQIVLDLNAVSGAGNLLGNLLCAVVGLLDGVGFLAGILQLLENINDILEGIGGLGNLTSSPIPTATGIGFQIHS